MVPPKKPDKVLTGMSGGLDSTITALLLKNAGYKVIGLTLKTWHTDPEFQKATIEKARKRAEELDIDHHVVQVEHFFKKNVVDYFCGEYLQGRTPNPCNRCNPLVKWPSLIEKADELGCRHIATGHYVQKVFSNGKWFIKKGADPQKDQSYFLWNLDQHILQRALFPLGEFKKSEVRQMALEHGLQETARQQESMGVCFLADTDYRDFLKQWAEKNNITVKPGEIVDENGNILGHHPGIPFFTIGQKRGLGIKDRNYSVSSMDASNNRLVVSPNGPPKTIQLFLPRYFMTESLPKGEEQKVSIRVRGIDNVPELPGRIRPDSGGLQVIFDQEAIGITPGQSIVFYRKGCVVGGGIV
ncbi:MAG: tRNA 2-thiouridine(34) synthase MnmA [Marinilabilia sp.]